MVANKEIPSRPLAVDPIIKQIDGMLEENGNVSQEYKDRLMFSMIKILVISVADVQNALDIVTQNQKRIDELERRNIVTWCIRHPGPATVLITLLVFLLFSHYGTTLLRMLGVDLP